MDLSETKQDFEIRFVTEIPIIRRALYRKYNNHIVKHLRVLFLGVSGTTCIHSKAMYAKCLALHNLLSNSRLSEDELGQHVLSIKMFAQV